MYRQGDCLLLPITDPAHGTLRAIQEGRYRLLLGEVTGHHHSVAAQPGVAVLDAPDGTTYLTIEELVGSVALEHQEHAALTLPPGTYRLVRQSEYTGPARASWVGD